MNAVVKKQFINDKEKERNTSVQLLQVYLQCFFSDTRFTVNQISYIVDYKNEKNVMTINTRS